jgi:hypothetical protein
MTLGSLFPEGGMKLRDILAQEGLRGRKIASKKRRFFHGTSSKFLPNIRSKGLLGTPPQRVWEDNLTAIPGHVYLTTSLNTAREYAQSAVSKFGGEPLFLVVELNRDDPRISAEEDLIPKVHGLVIDQNIHGLTRGEFSPLWILHEYFQGDPPYPEMNPRDELRYLNALMGANTLRRFIDQEKEAFKAVRNPKPHWSDNIAEGQVPGIAQNIKANLAKDFYKALGNTAMSGFVEPERILDFLSSGIVETLMNAPNQSGGNRAKTWMRQKAQWEKEWPEWFGPEAGLVTRERPTVMVEAKALRPKEMWEVPSKDLRHIRRYEDLWGWGIEVSR